MNFDENISMLSMAFYQVLLVSGPILILALGIGLFIGIIQAATSINEMTLSFCSYGDCCNVRNRIIR